MFYKNFIVMHIVGRFLRPLIKVFLVVGLVAVTYFIGCSETYFGSVVVNCEELQERFDDGSCQPIRLGPETPEDSYPDPVDDPSHFMVRYTVDIGQVDILFVVDNSSSMHEEQKNIAGQMEEFLNRINHLDYRIAVTTTDISSSPGNPVRGRSYQDGRFISMNGQYYIENRNRGGKTDERDLNAFIEAVQRPESLACAKPKVSRHGKRGLRTNRYEIEQKLGFYPSEEPIEDPVCPSSDERAIYASNLSVERYRDVFFRDEAHLMIVIISDEDERSSGLYIEQYKKLNRGDHDYSFETRDYPETLVETVYKQLGPLKTFSVHSAIIRPGDKSCLRAQNRNSGQGVGTGAGYYGEEYAKLSRASSKITGDYGNLLRGSIISICDRNYSRQLGRVAIYAEIPRISLACSDPTNIQFKEEGRLKRFNYYIEGRSITIEDRIKINSQITISMICKK